MDFHSFRFASQAARLAAAAAVVLLLAGCDVRITDRTPTTFDENPSQVYTITAEVKVQTGVLRRGTLQPNVVIDGEMHPMSPSALGKNMWEYEYHMPPGRSEAKYYILAAYETEAGGRVNQRESYSEIRHIRVQSRYVMSLDANRAPVGAQVSVLGRGFTPDDVVFVGSQSAPTSFLSPNSLSFTVPPVPAGRNYTVTVGPPGVGRVGGTLRVDEGMLVVTPGAVGIGTGEKQMLVFTIPAEAPPGGIMLDVTTDVPASVIMPEVIIEGGRRSVSVAVQGGKPGSGTLYVVAPGFGEVRIPVIVSTP